MRLDIRGLKEIRERLERLRVQEVMARALGEQAERMAEAVRDGLSAPAGSGDHDKPWTRTGALRDSIGVTANGLEAVVGSSNPAAAPQEMGTSRIPPRPFLAPVAAGMGEAVARAIGERIAVTIKDAAGTDDHIQLDTTPVGISTPSPGTAKFVAGARNVTRASTEFLAQSASNAQEGQNHSVLLAAGGGTPGNNQAQNRQMDDVVRILKLTPDQRQQLHRAISGMNYNFQEILDEARSIFGD